MRGWRRISYSINTDYLKAIAIFLALALLVLPLPTWLLDILLAFNFAFGIAAFLWALRRDEIFAFAPLPSLLVMGSLLRVGIALAAGRSAMAAGSGGSLAYTMGLLLTHEGTNWISGAATCGILLLALHLMLTSGLTRLAEVAARFALDALPGRQMALDTALRQGWLPPEQGPAQAQQLQAENAFYGAMDGAVRFMRGETALIAVIVVLIPALGWLQAGLGMGSPEELANIAIGLCVAVLTPGFLMGLATAIVLSRPACGLPASYGTESFLQPSLLFALALALLALGAVPGLSKAPFVLLALAAALWAWHKRQHRIHPPPQQEPAEAIYIRLGSGLLSLLASQDMPHRISRWRANLSDALGFALPPFYVTDEADLPPHDFRITRDGTSLQQASLYPGRRLAIAPGKGRWEGFWSSAYSEDFIVQLPAGKQGLWLRPEEEPGEWLQEGCQLLGPLDVLELYVRDCVTRQAAELFNLQHAREILEAVRVSAPAIVQAYKAAGLSEADLRDVGRYLLAEGIPLLERITLLEAMTSAQASLARESRSACAAELAEHVRPSLRRTITQLVAPEGLLEAMELSESLREELQEAITQAQEIQRGMLDEVPLAPERAERWRQRLRWAAAWEGWTGQAVLLCPRPWRRMLAKLAQEAEADVQIIAPDELLPMTQIAIIYVLQGQEGEIIPASAKLGRGE